MSPFSIIFSLFLFAFSFLIVMEESFLIVKISNCVWISLFIHLSSVQSSHVWLFVTPWTAALQASLSVTNSWSLLKLMPIASVMPSNHLILCHPVLLPSIFPITRVFSNESVFRIRWLKYCSFSFSISPFSEYSGLISFRRDWFDLLAAQGALKSFLQCYSSKASILWYSAFFYGPTLTSIHDYWKNHSFKYMTTVWLTTNLYFVYLFFPGHYVWQILKRGMKKAINIKG